MSLDLEHHPRVEVDFAKVTTEDGHRDKRAHAYVLNEWTLISAGCVMSVKASGLKVVKVKEELFLAQAMGQG